MNRKQKRILRNSINPCKEVFVIIKQYFPELMRMFKGLTDKRHQSYVTYNMEVISLIRLMGLVCGIKNMSNISDEFNTDKAILNINKFLGLELNTTPHHDTINDVFEDIKIGEIRDIQKYIIKSLIRGKMFDKFKYNEYFHITFDGTGIVSFKEKHCKHCLKREHKEDDGSITTTYFHYVLEAKLVVDNMVFSIDSEFIENEKETVEKQDCEIKAFKRLSKRIKKNYPKLNIIISGDSLYASKPIMKICKEYKWEYIITFKSGSIKTLAIEFENIKKEKFKNYEYSNDCIFGSNKNDMGSSNVIRYKEKEKTFTYITSIEINKTNHKEIVRLGRNRWKIENEGFNFQKNGIFNIEHLYSRNHNAMCVHYLFIQIAHVIINLLVNGHKDIHLLKDTIKKVSSLIKDGLTNTTIDLNDFKKIQLRFIT